MAGTGCGSSRLSPSLSRLEPSLRRARDGLGLTKSRPLFASPRSCLGSSPLPPPSFSPLPHTRTNPISSPRPAPTRRPEPRPLRRHRRPRLPPALLRPRLRTAVPRQRRHVRHGEDADVQGRVDTVDGASSPSSPPPPLSLRRVCVLGRAHTVWGRALADSELTRALQAEPLLVRATRRQGA